MKHKTLSLLALSLAFIAQNAIAASDDPDAYNRHQGVYAEANAGTNVVYTAFVSSKGSKNIAAHNGLGWNANLGYQFNPILGLEAGFMQNYAKYTNDSGETGKGVFNVPYAAARLTAPIGNRFSLFAKVGAMGAIGKVTYSDSSDTEKALLPYVGVGAGVSVTPHLDLNVQYQGAVYGVVGAGLLGGGLTYHF